MERICGKPARPGVAGTFSEIGARRKGDARRILPQAGFDAAASHPILRRTGPWKGMNP